MPFSEKRKGWKFMSGSSLILEIQLSYNQFTKTEKKIADFVLHNTNKVLFMSITELAEECGVAEASVHRFCRTMGVKGYQEFKMKLSLSITPEDDSSLEKDFSDKDSLDFNLDRILQSHISALKETRMLLHKGEVERSVRMIEEATNVYFFGIGDSLLSARGARNKFLRICNKVNCIEDPHMQAMTASMAGPEDVIFIISYSRHRP